MPPFVFPGAGYEPRPAPWTQGCPVDLVGSTCASRLATPASGGDTWPPLADVPGRGCLPWAPGCRPVTVAALSQRSGLLGGREGEWTWPLSRALLWNWRTCRKIGCCCCLVHGVAYMSMVHCPPQEYDSDSPPPFFGGFCWFLVFLRPGFSV